VGTLLQGGTVVTDSAMFPADVLIEGEQIARIGAALPADGHTRIDCTDRLLLPGGIDVHTHLHLAVAETGANSGYDAGHRAAAFGGTTTHMDFVSQPIGGTLAEGLAIWRRKAEIASIDYGFHMTVVDPRDEVLAEIPAMLDEGIPTIKLLMAYKGAFMIDDEGLYKVMQVCQQHDMLVMTHCENGDAEALLRRDLLVAGKTAMNYHADSRPASIEAEATNRAVMMAGVTGAHLYVVHMTCDGALKALRRGRRQGLPVMGETCIQYFLLTAEEHLGRPGFEAARYICSPPLRTQRDQEALWRAARLGEIQVVATDHCDFWWEGGVGPWQEWAATHDNHTWDAYEAQDPTYRRPGKELGRDRFDRVPNGLPGIEDRLLLLWHHGVNGGRLTPSQFVALTSTNPARIFGLAGRKGAIQPGADADILIWDPAAEHVISAQTHHMKTDYNCYEGTQVRGKPEKVFLRGRMIIDGDRWLGEQGAGRFLARGADGQVL